MIKKVVQTFWVDNEKYLNGGWLNTKFHLMGWGLSSLTFSRFFENLELITDAFGKEILIDRLQLPYNSLSLAQEDYRSEFEKIWVLRKIYSYSLQNEPFIHADGDAFLFNLLKHELLDSPLIAQNFEYNYPDYIKAFNEINEKCRYLPSYIKKDKDGKLSAVNAGIIGGNEFLFFKTFAKEIDIFLYRNQDYINKLKLHTFSLNVFLEQFLFKKIADELALPITVQLKEHIEYPLKSYATDQFWELPRNCDFCHLMSYKRNPTSCEQMAQRLYIESPELHHKIVEVSKKLDSENYYFAQQSKLNVSQPDTLFYRTFTIAHALGYTLPKEKYLEDFISHINQWLMQLPTNLHTNILKDVWQYELEKYAFVSNLPNHDEYRQYRKEQSLITNSNLNTSYNKMLLQKIAFGKYLASIESEWKWVENNEFTHQNETGTFTFDYLSNFTSQPSFFIVILFIYPEEMSVKEQLLSPLNIFIINALSDCISIDNVINNVIEDIKLFDKNINVEKYTEEIISQIRYLLYQGILVFK
jgi:hypothetical protein